MRSVILSASSFPWGMAASTRVRCLAKGMMSEGIQVEYIGLSGANVADTPDKLPRGIQDGIPYSYPGGFAVRPASWLMRRVDDVFGKWLSLARILRMKAGGKIDMVMIYSRDHKVVKFWSKWLKLANIPVILELCEWPLAIASTKNEGYRKARMFCEEAILYADAIIPISSYIENEVRRISHDAGKKIPSMKIPILVDTEYEEDPAPGDRKDSEPYLLYAGAISYFDIAMIVVDIAEKLKDENIAIRIKFTGGGDTGAFEKLKEYAARKNVLDRFEFMGYVSDIDFHELMRQAIGLLAPLPENLQSVARFPTKLGYYLSSGTVVITNAIGDVDKYLRDGINAYVADACDSGQFADKIQSLLQDPEHSKEMGMNGRRLAFETFHYEKACRGIREFLESVRTA